MEENKKSYSLDQVLKWLDAFDKDEIYQKLKDLYVKEAMEFIKNSEDGDNLTYMVFAEQRWMAMCADYLSIPIHEFSSLSVLFGGKQKYFTHLGAVHK